MKALVLGLSVLALAVGPAVAVQPSTDEGAKRTAQGRNDGVVAGKCISRAFHQGDAEAFCGAKLSCAAPAAVKCKGGSSRWVCSCKS